MSKNYPTDELLQLKNAISASDIARITALGEYINSPLDEEGNTALLLAVWAGNVPLVKELLDLNADVNSKNNKLYTPLHMAVYDNYCKENQYEIAELLLQQKADVNARTHYSQSPLAMSMITRIKTDNTKVIMSLLKHGADPNIQQEPKKITATHIAVIKCDYGLIKVLVDHGADITITNHKQENALQYLLNDPVLKFDSNKEKYIRTVTFLTLLEGARDEANLFSKLSTDLIFLISGYVYKAPYLSSQNTQNIEEPKDDISYLETGISGGHEENDCW